MPEESTCINMQILHGDPQGAGSGCLNSTSPLSTSSLRFMQVSVILARKGLKVRLLLGAPREVSPPRLRLRSELDSTYPSAAPPHARFHPETLVFLRLPPAEEQKPSARPPVVSITFLISRLLSLPFTFYLLLFVFASTRKPSQTSPTCADTIPYLPRTQFLCSNRKLDQKRVAGSTDARAQPQSDSGKQVFGGGDRRRKRKGGVMGLIYNPV